MQADGTILPIREVSPARRGEMFALMARYYENVRRSDFETDLAEKDWVIELTDPQSGRLCGFSTQMVFPAEVGGRTVFALFSGDTIVDAAYRRKNPLAGLWGRFALRLAERFPPERSFWFLISKGYKTYRFLPVFFRSFFPRFGAATPDEIRQLIDALGRRKFARHYDAANGIVRADPDGCRLRPGAADVTSRRLRDPHVRFFCERNPGHSDGDELCCIAALGCGNFTPAAWKVIASVPELPPPLLADVANRCGCLPSRALSSVAIP
jgi:hypothetical protein